MNREEIDAMVKDAYSRIGKWKIGYTPQDFILLPPDLCVGLVAAVDQLTIENERLRAANEDVVDLLDGDPCWDRLHRARKVLIAAVAAPAPVSPEEPE